MLTVDFDRLGLAPGMRVLDSGCGEGRHAFEVRRRGGIVCAMDLRPADLRRTRFLLAGLARERTAGAVPALTLRGNTGRLPFAAERFDRVICSEVLEHVDDPRGCVAELARVLRPQGLLAVSVPTPVTERTFRFASDDYFNTPGGHVRIFTPARLTGLLGAAGLEVVDFHFEHAFHSLYWWTRGVFGLHDEGHPVIRHFKKVLTYALFSPRLVQAEGLLNWVWPKSMVVYVRKASAS